MADIPNLKVFLSFINGRFGNESMSLTFQIGCFENEVTFFKSLTYFAPSHLCVPISRIFNAWFGEFRSSPPYDWFMYMLCVAYG